MATWIRTAALFQATAFLATAWVVESASAQAPRLPPGMRAGPGAPGGGGQGQAGRGGNNAQPKPEFKLPDDPRLIEMHKTFVLGVEKLATEYERTNQIDKARSCYEEILRLVPTYTPATEKLAGIQQREATAERRSMDVYANKGWQDAGLNIVAGKPVSVKSSGIWTMKMTYNLPPDGIEIPKELRDYPLGALVGKIGTSPTDEEGKVFLIGSSTSIIADRDGRLFLRMYDSDPEDNIGKLTVSIEGTFKK